MGEKVINFNIDKAIMIENDIYMRSSINFETYNIKDSIKSTSTQNNLQIKQESSEKDEFDCPKEDTVKPEKILKQPENNLVVEQHSNDRNKDLEMKQS